LTNEEILQHAKELLELRTKNRNLHVRLQEALDKIELHWQENIRLKRLLKEMKRAG
jgi:hypothetical protein